MSAAALERRRTGWDVVFGSGQPPPADVSKGLGRQEDRVVTLERPAPVAPVLPPSDDRDDHCDLLGRLVDVTRAVS